MPQSELEVRSDRKRQVIDVTERVDALVASAGVRHGLCQVFAQHTTCAVACGEAIEGTDEDLLETLTTMIPKIRFRHGHDPSHAPDHMIGSIVGPGLTVPIRDGKLAVGTWQRVLLVECNGPRARTLIVTMIGDGARA